LIFSVRNQVEPLRLFAKTPAWPSPKLIGQVKPGESVGLGSVRMTFEKVIPTTGLQYKSDPGLPLTYTAFAFIIAGVMLAVFPHRQLWAHLEPDLSKSGGGGTVLTLGGFTNKAKSAFGKTLAKLVQELPATALVESEPEAKTTQEEEKLCQTSS
jgi:cytochrome c biogenesis protein